VDFPAFVHGPAAAVALTALLCCGCGGAAKPPGEEGMRRFAVLYGEYVAAHKGQPPGSAEQLKAFVRKMDQKRRDMIGVKDVEDAFLSPHDNLPYVVVPRKKSRSVPNPSEQQQTVIAHEQTPRGDKRLVAFVSTQVQEIDEARFKELVPDAR
jgi:hypothetical protein